jgi:hypothetical protein
MSGGERWLMMSVLSTPETAAADRTFSVSPFFAFRFDRRRHGTSGQGIWARRDPFAPISN